MGNEYKKRRKKKMRGKDIEAVKGTVCYLPNTGVHEWVICWESEPRDGSGDSIGICGGALEDFAPSSQPLGGEKDSGSSMALFANGHLYHMGKIIAEYKGGRQLAVEK